MKWFDQNFFVFPFYFWAMLFCLSTLTRLMVGHCTAQYSQTALPCNDKVIREIISYHSVSVLRVCARAGLCLIMQIDRQRQGV